MSHVFHAMYFQSKLLCRHKIFNFDYYSLHCDLCAGSNCHESANYKAGWQTYMLSMVIACIL